MDPNTAILLNTTQLQQGMKRWHKLHYGQALKTCQRERERPDVKGHILYHPLTKTRQNGHICRKLDGHQRMLGNETCIDTAQRMRKVPSGVEAILLARKTPPHTLE